MKLFNFGKAKNEGCGCGDLNTSNIAKQNDNKCECGGNCGTQSEIKILGSGCAKCNSLEKATVEALKQLGMETTVDHVNDFAKIAAYGVMSTPALVVDGKVVSMGKVLKTEEVEDILKKVRG